MNIWNQVLKFFLIGSMSAVFTTACVTEQGAEDVNRNRTKANQIQNYYEVNDTRTHQNQQFDVPKDIAEALSHMDEIKTANVLLTERNAYIAIVLDDNQLRVKALGQSGDVTEKIKDKIANKVKAMHPQVENVYVSANPNFNERMQNYIDKIESGDPVEGLVEEFNTMVRRVFPANPINNR